jgi:hypothetical protein
MLRWLRWLLEILDCFVRFRSLSRPVKLSTLPDRAGIATLSSCKNRSRTGQLAFEFPNQSSFSRRNCREDLTHLQKPLTHLDHVEREGKSCAYFLCLRSERAASSAHRFDLQA